MAEVGAATEYDLRISLPDHPDQREQGEEWCEVQVNGTSRRVGFHDYETIFSIPGLYEALFYELLNCDSPRIVVDLLGKCLEEEGEDPAELRALDVGAGNGMVGERLRELGAGHVIGVDIIEEAAEAAERDRPGAYDGYRVLDLSALDERDREELAAERFNCMTSVAALGFGDLPPQAFAGAFDLVADGGWVAFCIKRDFIGESDPSGFRRLIRHALDDGSLEQVCGRRYLHRFSAAGEPIHYVAIVARKRGDLPAI
jgi:predicted TPR repeat methyltransferase